MYGHGANAFACYPGITRARRENHIWLPLDVVESEQTQARLGAARSERERLERAIDAFARFLGQSRPDGMVSDLLYDPRSPRRCHWSATATPKRPVPRASTGSAGLTTRTRPTSTCPSSATRRRKRHGARKSRG